MAFRGEVDDVGHTPHRGADLLAVRDVAFDEGIAWVRGDIREVREVPRVGEAVEVDDADVRIGREQVPNEVRTNKARTAGNEYGRHETLQGDGRPP